MFIPLVEIAKLTKNIATVYVVFSNLHNMPEFLRWSPCCFVNFAVWSQAAMISWIQPLHNGVVQIHFFLNVISDQVGLGNV